MATPRCALAAMILAVMAVPCAGQVTRPVAEAAPDALLAARLEDLAGDTLHVATLTTAGYREAGLLYEAAGRLDPAQGRYPRMRHEAMLEAGEIPDAIAGLVAYARTDPSDLQAQAKLIELYAQRMETADAKLRYLRQDIIPNAGLPEEIRSHAALLAARVLLERGERGAAAGMAKEAVRLNAYNGEAQRLKFDLLSRDSTALDRLNGLLAIARACPLDLAAVSAVAGELDEAGLDESARWYDASLGLTITAHQAPPRELLTRYAARLMIVGTPAGLRDAEGLVTRIAQADAGDVDAHLIRLSLLKLTGEPGAVAQEKGDARGALLLALRDVATAAGAANAVPATQPAAGASTQAAAVSPDHGAIADKVLALGNAQVRSAYVSAVSTLAFVDLFFREDVGAATPAIEALRKVEPANSPLLARLDGWSFLVQKKEAEARLKLSAVEGSDPLASLGLLRLEADPQAAGARARALRAGAHGTVGAMVASEIQPRRTPLVLGGQAEAMRAAMKLFPTEILRLIDAPQSFYVLKADPIGTAQPYGHPQLVQVTVINTSNYDLPIGPHGAIHQDLWFDAVVRGLHPEAFPNTAFDRLGGPLVLRPRQVASRIVRLDQDRLLVHLRHTPFFSIPLLGTVCTNPVFAGGHVVGGPGGFQAPFGRLMEQTPLPFGRPEQRQALLKALAGGGEMKGERIPALDAALLYNTRAKEDNQPDVSQALAAAVTAATDDGDPNFRAWALFQVVNRTADSHRSEAARAAATDGYWVARMLVLCGMRASPTAEVRAFAGSMLKDPEPLVGRYAQAILDEMEELPATRPATQP